MKRRTDARTDSRARAQADNTTIQCLLLHNVGGGRSNPVRRRRIRFSQRKQTRENIEPVATPGE